MQPFRWYLTTNKVLLSFFVGLPGSSRIKCRQTECVKTEWGHRIFGTYKLHRGVFFNETSTLRRQWYPSSETTVNSVSFLRIEKQNFQERRIFVVETVVWFASNDPGYYLSGENKAEAISWLHHKAGHFKSRRGGKSFLPTASSEWPKRKSDIPVNASNTKCDNIRTKNNQQ